MFNVPRPARKAKPRPSGIDDGRCRFQSSCTVVRAIYKDGHPAQENEFGGMRSSPRRRTNQILYEEIQQRKRGD